MSSEKHCESSFKQFQSTSKCVNSSLTHKLILWQIDDLISTFVNKLMTAALEVDEQYSCNIRKTDSKVECLIWILSLQVIIQSKIRLTADNLILYNEINSFN